MKENLRLSDSIENVRHLFDPSFLSRLEAAEHKTNFISTQIAGTLSQMVDQKFMNDFPFLKAEEARGVILDCQGACERILKTPMPFVMAIKSRRFIFLFLIILPIALVPYPYYINPLVTALVSYALFSLDRIGIELQNPFSVDPLSHLPLDSICEAIENNVGEIYQVSNQSKTS